MLAISVLMPVYNGERYLEEAIRSILTQRFSDFEFLIFNDGSTDRSKEIVTSFHDPRIKLIDSDRNQGYVPLLNAGLRLARGKYIARMDADDVSHPDRFLKQFDFLEQHPDHVLCGTRFITLNERQVAFLPEHDEEIRLKLLYITPFCHPSVMLRADVFRNHQIFYNEGHMPAEDHELWVRLSEFGKFANLPEPLLEYRVHDNNISLKPRNETQISNLRRAHRQYISIFFSRADVSDTDVEMLYQLFFNESGFNYQQLQHCGRVVEKFFHGNYTYPVATKQVHELLVEKFFYRCTTSTHEGLKVFFAANQFPFKRPPLLFNAKLFIKAMFRYNGVKQI